MGMDGSVRGIWKLKIVKTFRDKEEAIKKAVEIAKNQKLIVKVKNKRGKFVAYSDKKLLPTDSYSIRDRFPSDRYESLFDDYESNQN
jgi:hypothetical protein